LKMLFTVLLLLASASVTLGSWICPVFTQEQMLAREFPESLASASIIEWECLIHPVPLINENMRAYADWDYQINETFVLAPVDGTVELYFCLDLGVTPEEKRNLQSITINGAPAQPCSVIAIPVFDNIADFEDGLFMIRNREYSDGLTPYILEDIETFRAGYENEEDFRSAVPECACFYAMLYRVEDPGEEVIIEASYLAQGWTYITGAAPLFYSVLQPGLWKNPITGSTINVDLSDISNSDEWLLELGDDQRSGDENLEFHMDGLDESLPNSIEGLLITPPELQ
jgi:hypothetical protein